MDDLPTDIQAPAEGVPSAPAPLAPPAFENAGRSSTSAVHSPSANANAEGERTPTPAAEFAFDAAHVPSLSAPPAASGLVDGGSSPLQACRNFR